MNLKTATAGAWARGLRRSPGVRRGVLGAVILLGLYFGWHALTTETLPDFTDHKNTEEKKEAFFSYLLPYVREINADILKDRKRLLKIRRQLSDGSSAGFFDDRFLQHKAEEYGFEDIPDEVTASFADLVLRRVDIIAPSLVLAQAANESAWGTSRFARHGNNLFGMRTYDGSGIVPKKRKAGKQFTVAVYDTPRDSIEAYVHNLNTHNRYKRLRQIRSSLRLQHKPVSGYALANGLMAYSSKGGEYISILQSMISSSNLGQYDTE